MPHQTSTSPGHGPRKYLQLAAALRDQITDGTLPPGHPVPSITELTGRYGWARQTCAHALRLLEDDGLLTRYPGLGYHVTPAAAPLPAHRPARTTAATAAPQA